MSTRWFEITPIRHSRIPGGPRVWTVIVRVGRKKQLEVVYR